MLHHTGITAGWLQSISHMHAPEPPPRRRSDRTARWTGYSCLFWLDSSVDCNPLVGCQGRRPLVTAPYIVAICWQDDVLGAGATQLLLSSRSGPGQGVTRPCVVHKILTRRLRCDMLVAHACPLRLQLHGTRIARFGPARAACRGLAYLAGFGNHHWYCTTSQLPQLF